MAYIGKHSDYIIPKLHLDCFAEDSLIAQTYKCIQINKNLKNGVEEAVFCRKLFYKFNILQFTSKFLLSLLPFIVHNMETFQTSLWYSQYQQD
jgi:hypothetical protein